jgi:hypothetical protein
MKLLAPDVLELTREFAPGYAAAALLLGLFLWLFGARSHRFWFALVLTLSAGLVGLRYGRDHDVQPLVAGLLLALAAGALALALARVLLFVAGGVAGLAVAHFAAAGWNEAVCFVVGGLTGVLLYQLWVTALSSLAGTLLMGYGLLSLLDRLGKLGSVAFAERNAPLLNWACAAGTVLGLLAQFLLERRRRRLQARKAAAPPDPEAEPWWKRPLKVFGDQTAEVAGPPARLRNHG